jgi:hypothetical protein
MGSNDTLKGNLMIDNTVTPVLNLKNGPTANRTYTLFTGLGNAENGTQTQFINEIGSIRSIDQGDGVVNTTSPYAWLNEKLWTGNDGQWVNSLYFN